MVKRLISICLILLWVFPVFMIYQVAVNAEEQTSVNRNNVLPHKERIMVVVPEFHVTHEVPDPAAETEIIRCLLHEKFPVVDQEISEQVRYSDKMKSILAGDTKAAQELGLRNAADIIVYGEAFSERAQGMYGLESCRARVEVRAVTCATGEIIAVASEFANAADMAELIAGKKALEKAGQYVCDSLIADLLEAFDERKSAGKYEVFLTNIDYEKLRKIEALIQEIDGARDVYNESFDGSTALLAVKCTSPLDAIASTLSEHDFEDFRLKITGLSANRLEVRAETVNE